MTGRRATTMLVLAPSLPGSLRDAFDRRFRFVLQPLIAIVLGIRSGLADARAGRPPYLSGVLFHRDHRGELVRTGFETVLNLLLIGILLEPVLIVAPYSLARALSNRLARLHGHGRR